MTIDVYSQYFEAELVFNEVLRRAALVKLTSDSEEGRIRYTAGVSFFPHEDEEDYAVSYDAFFEKEIYNAKGRRSKKREVEMISKLPAVIDELAKEAGGKVFWEKAL